MREGKIEAKALTIVALLAWLAASPVLAQRIQGLPRQSQQQVIIQTIGITEVTIAYHRPQVRGRSNIWGGLVPWDQVWRAGANDNTTIRFSDPVKIEGHDLAAGTYGLHMLPGEKQWQVIFSTNSTSWGTFYDETEDALRVAVKPQKSPYQEVMEFRFDHLTSDGGVVVLHWDELEVPFEIEVDTNALVLAKIDRDLRHTPGFSWMGYNSAADYCRQNDVCLEQGMEWIERALGMEENFANLRVKSGLLERMGKTDEALALAEQLLENASEAEANGLGYQFLQRGNVDKAIEIFAKNTRDHPEAWNVWDSLGEAQAQKGLTQEAIASYSKALEMAPDPQKPRITAILEGFEDE